MLGSIDGWKINRKIEIKIHPSIISDPSIIMIPTVVWERLLGKFLWIVQPLSSHNLCMPDLVNRNPSYDQACRSNRKVNSSFPSPHQAYNVENLWGRRVHLWNRFVSWVNSVLRQLVSNDFYYPEDDPSSLKDSFNSKLINCWRFPHWRL